jgi:hypothetical protein
VSELIQLEVHHRAGAEEEKEVGSVIVGDARGGGGVTASEAGAPGKSWTGRSFKLVKATASFRSRSRAIITSANDDLHAEGDGAAAATTTAAAAAAAAAATSRSDHHESKPTPLFLAPGEDRGAEVLSPGGSQHVDGRAEQVSWTVLHAAADAGRVSAVRVLLDGKAHQEAKEMLEAKWWDDATVSERSRHGLATAMRWPSSSSPSSSSPSSSSSSSSASSSASSSSSSSSSSS